MEQHIPLGTREETVRLTLVAIAAPSRVSQCVCARVSVRVSQYVCARVSVRVCFIWKRLNTCLCPHCHKTHLLMRSTHMMMHKQVECIYSKTHTSSILSECHSCESKHAYVCLLTLGRSVLRRLRPAARTVGCRKGKVACGEEGGNSQTYTLSPSQRLRVCLSACAIEHTINRAHKCHR
jgi:hypothetical protein